MIRASVVVLAGLLVAVAPAQSPMGSESRKPSALVYAVETGGALLGGGLVGAGATVVLGFAGALAQMTLGWPRQQLGITVFELRGLVIGGVAGAAIGCPLGCGWGTNVAGRALGVDGNTGQAYTGAYAGMALGALAGFTTGSFEVALGAMGVLSPAGAVIGYNLGAPRSYSQSPLGSRLAPPTLAFSPRLGPDGQRYSAFDCRLVTVGF